MQTYTPPSLNKQIEDNVHKQLFRRLSLSYLTVSDANDVTVDFAAWTSQRRGIAAAAEGSAKVSEKFEGSRFVLV